MNQPSRSCLVCGDICDKWIQATIHHFRPIDWEQRSFIRGNFKAFGVWSGLRANITLLFPVMNTLFNWKYRKSRLVFADGSEQPFCERRSNDGD